MNKNLVKFNVNDNVRVRLTDRGRAIHRDRFRKLNAVLPLNANYKYTPPKEDNEGWSTWQMWNLMSIFGDYLGQGQELPFETTIEIVLEEVPQVER